jgi:hypothetical protein
MMGKDIWVFFLYFETDGSRSYSVRCEKDSLAVANGSTSATAALKAVDGNPPRILASMKSNGADYERINLILDRAIGKGALQDSIQQELATLTRGDGVYKEASWSPVKGNGVEVVWIFSSSGFQRGHLRDLLKVLGAGGRETDDFIIADDPAMSYQIGLMLEGRSNLEINDWAGFEFAKNLL